MIKVKSIRIEEAPNNWSEVFDYKENIDELEQKLSKYKDTKNIIIIGNGGSITSYDAYLGSLGSSLGSATIWTMEPDYLTTIKKKFSKEDTIVIPISKSGNTLGLIEALSAFMEYRILAVTNPSEGVLSEIAKKMNWDIIPHPPIGGRFSGGTSSAFVPAILAGIDTRSIQKGMTEGYRLKDLAYSLSKYFYDLEENGYNEVYISIYSQRLKDFQNMIIQLMHESVCKQQKGQTFYCSLAPESQHHTNQRFLGGKKNVIGVFITIKEPENDIKIELPNELKEINYKNEKLSIINGIRYQDGLKAEYIGTKLDADNKSVPNVTIEIEKVSPQNIGEFMAFWHLVAFYSSVIRDVNPFDQPAVEDSKNITLNEIKKLI